jgi:phosphoserine phosphatase
MDGTLIKRPSSWERLHQYYNTQDKEERYLKAYLRGEIDYREFMRRDIRTWGKKLHINEIKRVLLSYEFMEGAYELASFLANRKITKGIITAGLDIVADDVTRKLNFDFYIANGFEVDNNGYLTGEGILRVEPLRKDEAIKNIMKILNVKKENIISVGDAHYDKGLFDYSKVSIGVGDDKLRPYVDYIAKDLRDVLRYLKKIL